MNADERRQKLNAKQVQKLLIKAGNKEKGGILQGFFKTGPGEYGEGDIFRGVMVPASRKIAVQFKNMPFGEIQKLLKSKIHEERLVAILIMVRRFQDGTEKDQKKFYNFYLKNTKHINNWDLVDLSAHKIVGAYLFNKSRKPLYGLVKSRNLWERRISVIATFYFINHNDFTDSMRLAARLLKDKHDLIHKAVGWMLREIGKRNLAVEEEFLKKHYRSMPRTMLRYAIEKFPELKRQKYLKKK
ncbi:DNA alkylation repair protein [Verrucomicrobiota bacterium]